MQTDNGEISWKESWVEHYLSCLRLRRWPSNLLPTNAMETVVVTAQRMQEQLEAERALTPGSVTVVDGRRILTHAMSATSPT